MTGKTEKRERWQNETERQPEGRELRRKRREGKTGRHEK